MLFILKNSGLTTVLISFGLLLGITDCCHSQNAKKLFSDGHKNSYQKTSEVYEVNSRYSVKLENASLRNALEQISKRAGLVLSYRAGLFEPFDEVSMRVRELNVERALQTMLGGTGLEYKITKTRHLVICKEKNVGHIKGDVIDAYSKEPLKGAKVLLVAVDKINGLNISKKIKESTSVSYTGRFNINNVEAGMYRLIIIDDGIKRVYKKVKIKDNKTAVESFRLKYPRK